MITTVFDTLQFVVPLPNRRRLRGLFLVSRFRKLIINIEMKGNFFFSEQIYKRERGFAYKGRPFYSTNYISSSSGHLRHIS